ncbi:hypothetical protein MSG28_000462 [Choristoneura fumiferana]|uniref:Uncharacterized protein n=1 Tax=Choristoneura fumiferana TaxID=7141 RepID=A0ACC0K0L5_CHOFU|nr:hypothetical protein MSG28_000462 [Choristoneura fumiferana]
MIRDEVGDYTRSAATRLEMRKGWYNLANCAAAAAVALSPWTLGWACFLAAVAALGARTWALARREAARSLIPSRRRHNAARAT